jgi:hypothetical protein
MSRFSHGLVCRAVTTATFLPTSLFTAKSSPPHVPRVVKGAEMDNVIKFVAARCLLSYISSPTSVPSRWSIGTFRSRFPS